MHVLEYISEAKHVWSKMGAHNDPEAGHREGAGHGL
jgi:hypothetical protein